MRQVYRFLKKCLQNFVNLCRGKKAYLKDRKTYIRLADGDTDFPYERKSQLACYTDRYENAGAMDEHYYLQDIYMAHKIFESAPEEHYDIGSRVDGFISHLLSFRKNITLIDIRPLETLAKVEGIKFLCADATDLKGIPDNSIESISSLHAIEHFGLGRYGDPIDPSAWKKSLHSMARVLVRGGQTLPFSASRKS